ncbi:MAG: preprotein translocase subunit SecA [bacterium]
MFNTLVEKIFGNKHEKEISRIQPVVDEINKIYPTLHELSDEELRNKTEQFKQIIHNKVKNIQEQIDNLKQELKESHVDQDLDIEEIRKQITELDEEEEEITEGVLQEILPEAFAVVKEACRRHVGTSWKVVGVETQWNMLPFDVQLIGAVVLHQGKIAEMATGEGKTLVATMPLYLNALVGKGAHLVTVNDYLAQRDCEWMGKIFEFLGLSVSYIKNDMPTHERKKAYQADITYGTNNEFGFDYLRDNMARSIEDMVQRGHYYTIIDEVDSVLIDEARTPLIISGPVPESHNQFNEMKPKVAQLVRQQTHLVSRLIKEAKELLENEDEKADYEAGKKLLKAQRGAPKNKRLTKLLGESGIQKLIRSVEADYMRDKKLHILDEELYYIIDEKNNTIDLTDKGREAMSPNNPEMFVLPDIATELTEIDEDESLSPQEKLEKREKIQTQFNDISEKLHNISQLLKAFSLFEKDVEYVVTEDGKVMIVDEFTGRLMPGRRFSDGLHQALEAKENVKVERETQTHATITLQNFFRLYTKLAGMTGTAETEADEFEEIYKLKVVVIPTNEPVRRTDHEDMIFKTKREKYKAIIQEIEEFHTAGLPVLVGTISVEVSETLSRMLKRKNIRHSVLNAKHHAKEAEIVTKAGEPGMATIATNMAGRGTDIKLGAGVIRYSEEGLETFARDMEVLINRKSKILLHEIPDNMIDTFSTIIEEKKGTPVVVETLEQKNNLLTNVDTWNNQDVVLIPRSKGNPRDAKVSADIITQIKVRDYAEGGLHIIGTERHEARRIDRQLRGRSGRQGDPGSSKFYLSLEDDLMRLFAPDKIVGVMDRLGLQEGEVITHSMITKSIERAQKRVEMRNFEIRKHLLEYDDVMNKQREIIYQKRKRALEGENLRDNIYISIEEFIEEQVEIHTEEDYSENWDWEGLSNVLLKTILLPLPLNADEQKDISKDELKDRLIDAALENYKRKCNALGDEVMGHLEKIATLHTIDEKWKEHLYEMDQLKEGINFRAYGQKDPLIEYKHEGFRAFKQMLESINDEILEIVFKANIEVEQDLRKQQQKAASIDMSTRHEDTIGMGFAGQPDVQQQQQGGNVRAGKKQPVKTGKKVGRNDPCPCGSGKKYKHCCGR